jgi:hypothetical protein
MITPPKSEKAPPALRAIVADNPFVMPLSTVIFVNNAASIRAE